MAIQSQSLAVTAAAVSRTVTGTFPSSYQVYPSANWNTSFVVSGKTTSQYVVTFGTPAPAGGGTLDVLVVGVTATVTISAALDIVNNALLLIGDQTITAMTDDVPRARFMNALWTPTLDEVLRMHNWNFAQVRTTLAPLICAPVWDFSYQFALPSDPLCLLVLETDMDEDDAWRVEYGLSCASAAATCATAYRVLVTDGCLSSILYIGRIDDVSMWDPLFVDALTYELAFRACYPLTRNAQLADVLRQEKEARWKLAKSRDGQEGRHLKSMLSTSLTSVR